MKNKLNPHKIKPLITSMLCLFLFTTAGMAQVKTGKGKVISIPFEAAHWDTSKQHAEFLTYKNVKAMKIVRGKGASNQVILKDFNFTNGTIEFDTQPIDGSKPAFMSVYFRQQSPGESEIVYLRTQPDESEQRNSAIQYAPVLHGINLWDLYGHFQGPAPIRNEDWNHFKLVISGLQMKVYLNNMERPVLQIPRLEGESHAGTIAFDGPGYFANLTVKPNETEGLSPEEGMDLTNHDINYIRRWDVSASQFLESGRELIIKDLPTDTTKWKPILAERRGLINLTRMFGGVENRYGGVQDKNRYVWLKTTIHATKEQIARIQLGFSDEVYVFINRGLLYVDKNQYPQPIRKYPDGRLDIANSAFDIPLKAGDNELIIGVSNYFYGWGIVARMQSMDGITVLQQ